MNRNKLKQLAELRKRKWVNPFIEADARRRCVLPLFSGLMGVDGDGRLYLPGGRPWLKLPRFVAFKIQRIQHMFVRR